MQLHYSYKRPLASASSLGGELSSSSISSSSSSSISSSGHSGYSIFLITMCLAAFYAVYGWGPFADLERKVLMMMFILILMKNEIKQSRKQMQPKFHLKVKEREAGLVISKGLKQQIKVRFNYFRFSSANCVWLWNQN